MSSVDKNTIISALINHKNVLLYGPPGTGKTRIVSEVVELLRNREPAGGQPTINLGNQTEMFGTASGGGQKENLPQNVDVHWVTFHQSYSYEEFILGKKPEPQDGGIVLKPYFGILMSIAIKVSSAGPGHACLLIIDEINRANASQVFGEFITLLDPDYRSTIKDEDNPKALKINLPGVSYEDGKSETVDMLLGDEPVQLPDDWTFPEHVYVLATMNSVDKAALPLDSALTRRFHRIELAPDIQSLSDSLGVVLDDLSEKVTLIKNGDVNENALTAEETSILILDKLNVHIASDIGEDFELGHALVWNVVKAPTDDRWQALISAWDHMILPQLKERYAGRTDDLIEVLNIYTDSPAARVFKQRTKIGRTIEENSPIEFTPLSRCKMDEAVAALKSIAL